MKKSDIYAFLIFAAMLIAGATIGCNPVDDKSPAGLMQNELKQIFTYHAIVAGCEVPLKLTQNAQNPEAQQQVDINCHRGASFGLTEANKKELSPSEAFTLACIRSSFDAIGIPKNDVEARKILEFCHDELGASQGN